MKRGRNGDKKEHGDGDERNPKKTKKDEEKRRKKRKRDKVKDEKDAKVGLDFSIPDVEDMPMVQRVLLRLLTQARNRPFKVSSRQFRNNIEPHDLTQEQENWVKAQFQHIVEEGNNRIDAEIARLNNLLYPKMEDDSDCSDDEDSLTPEQQDVAKKCQQQWENYSFNWGSIREFIGQGGELGQLLSIDVEAKLKRAKLKQALAFYKDHIVQAEQKSQDEEKRNEEHKAFFDALKSAFDELHEYLILQLTNKRLLSGDEEKPDDVNNSLDVSALESRLTKLKNYLLAYHQHHVPDDIRVLCRGLCAVVSQTQDMENKQLLSFWSRFPMPEDSDDWLCTGGVYIRFKQSLIYGNCFYSYLRGHCVKQTNHWKVWKGNDVHRMPLALWCVGLTEAIEGDPGWAYPLQDLFALNLQALYTYWGPETLQQAIVDDVVNVIGYANQVLRAWRDNLNRMARGELPAGTVPSHLSDQYLDNFIQASPLLLTLKSKQVFRFDVGKHFVIEDDIPLAIHVRRLLKACFEGLIELKAIEKNKSADSKQDEPAIGITAMRRRLCQLLAEKARLPLTLYPWVTNFRGKDEAIIIKELEEEYHQENNPPWFPPLTKTHFEQMARRIVGLLSDYNDKYQEMDDEKEKLVNARYDDEVAKSEKEKLEDECRKLLERLIERGAEHFIIQFIVENIPEEIRQAIKKKKLRLNLSCLPYHPQGEQIMDHCGGYLDLTYSYSGGDDDNEQYCLMGNCIRAAWEGVDEKRVCALIRAMVRHDINVCLKPAVGIHHPLLLACNKGCMDIVCCLVKVMYEWQNEVQGFNYKAWVDAKDKYGDAALHWAARCGHAEAVRVLCEQGADKEAKNVGDDTALLVAVKVDAPEAIRVLCEQGADKEAKDEDGDTALHVAVKVASPEAIRVLCEQGADKEAKNKRGDTALHVAVRIVVPEAIRVLCEQGADKEARNDRGETPLHTAVKIDAPEAIRVLCEQGADVEARNDRGEPPLHVAVGVASPEAIRVLSGEGADIEARNERGDTALHVAIEVAAPEAIWVLCEQGADIEARNESGETPLHVAVGADDLEAIQELCKQGANKEAENEGGYTALELAVQRNELAVVRTLCEQGADNVYKRVKAIEEATVRGYTEILEILRSVGV